MIEEFKTKATQIVIDNYEIDDLSMPSFTGHAMIECFIFGAETLLADGDSHLKSVAKLLLAEKDAEIRSIMNCNEGLAIALDEADKEIEKLKLKLQVAQAIGQIDKMSSDFKSLREMKKKLK